VTSVVRSTSDAVKRWRHNTKAKIVIAMGGECGVCGYDKCNSALALHHLDPTKKDISFGAIRANPKRWSDIVIELRKCVLVCHNCHTEIHAGVTELPTQLVTFDESYSDYNRIVADFNTGNCRVCDASIPEHQTTCSITCTGKLGKIVDWSRIDLVSELVSKSYTNIADELGVSSGAVAKRAKKLGLKSSFTNIKKVSECPICGDVMGSRSITCSTKCASIRQHKIDWNSIDLKKELESKSYVKLADELGVSDAAIHKRAKKLGLKDGKEEK
jgi:biotin operon repressor